MQLREKGRGIKARLDGEDFGFPRKIMEAKLSLKDLYKTMSKLESQVKEVME